MKRFIQTNATKWRTELFQSIIYNIVGNEFEYNASPIIFILGYQNCAVFFNLQGCN